MVATNLKAETVRLMEERDGIESELNAVIERLSQPGAPGLSGNLLDSEGFPRAEIDIPAVLADRRRLTELKNNHKDLTEKIDQNIVLLHATKPGPKLSTILDAEKHMEVDGQFSTISNDCVAASLDYGCMTSTPAPAGTGDIAKIPFAIVDEIAESSPAAEDGLQLGDQILKFGSVESGENTASKLAQEVQTYQGSAISVAIMRQGALTSLSITPRTWQGRGLLGCHFKLL